MKQMILGLLLCIFATTAHAAPITSLADPALAGGTTIDFETQTIGYYPSMTIGDVTFSGIGGDLRISNDSNGEYVPPSSTFLDNKTGGTGFQFDFSTGVNAFALKIGATNDAQTLTAYDSLDNVLGVINIPDQVETQPYPFTGVYGLAFDSELISKAILTANFNDWIVLDDFTYGGTGAPVPEPSTFLLLGGGLLGLGYFGRKRMKS